MFYKILLPTYKVVNTKQCILRIFIICLSSASFSFALDKQWQILLQSAHPSPTKENKGEK